MKFQEMKPGIAYNVTKGSTDGTFQAGDVIAIVPKDKSILLMNAGGWLENSDYQDLPMVTDFECVVDKEHYFWQDQVRAGFKEIPRPGTTRFSWDDQLDAIAEESSKPVIKIGLDDLDAVYVDHRGHEVKFLGVVSEKEFAFLDLTAETPLHVGHSYIPMLHKKEA